MKGNVILVGGSKGGVGKSMVSISLVDYYLERQRPLVLIETDSSNPDVFKIYKQLLDGKTYAVDLDSKDGWLNMMNIIADNAKDSDVIINTAARSNVGIEQHGSMLNDALEDLNRNLITLWPINRQRDSVQLLQMYMNKMTARYTSSETHTSASLINSSITTIQRSSRISKRDGRPLTSLI